MRPNARSASAIGALDLVGVGHVEGQRHRVAFAPGDDIGDLLRIARGRHDAKAVPKRRAGELAAEAARAAGDQPDRGFGRSLVHGSLS